MDNDGQKLFASSLRAIAKDLAGKDREQLSSLVARRRAVGLTQGNIDEAFGLPEGSTNALEAYDSDPRLSELRRYEAYILLHESFQREIIFIDDENGN